MVVVPAYRYRPDEHCLFRDFDDYRDCMRDSGKENEASGVEASDWVDKCYMAYWSGSFNSAVISRLIF